MLSDSKIKTLKPLSKVHRVTDSDGLCIEIKPNGKKVWRFRFRYLGKSLMMTLGEYPIVGLAEARRKRDDAKVDLANDINPIEKRRESRAAAVTEIENTFENIANEYALKRLNDKSQDYNERFNGVMRRDVYPLIGKKDVREITSADVLKIMNESIKRISKQSNFGTGEYSAIQTRKFIGAVMRYAIATLRADYDPTYAVRDAIKSPRVEHAQPLSQDAAKLFRSKIDSYQGSMTVKNAGLSMLYSMLRSIEIRRMQWDFVDFDQRIITFPISSTRSGQERTMKKDRVHIVPMSNQLFDLLKKQYELTSNRPYVFASVYKDGMLGESTLNAMLSYIGLKGVTSHDFRATASTVLNEKGYDEDWVELQLAHSSDNKTRASYNHAKYLDQRRKMLQDWADIVDSWQSE